MKFLVLFTYDDEYEGYVAEVPELPGCLSQGKSFEEASENIRDAISGYLLVLEKHNTPYTPGAKPSVVAEIAV